MDQSDGRDRGWNNEHAPAAGPAAEFGATPATGEGPQYQAHRPGAISPVSGIGESNLRQPSDEPTAISASERSQPASAEMVSEAPSIANSATDYQSTLCADEFAPQTTAAVEPSLSTSCTQEFDENEPWPQPTNIDVSLGTASAEPVDGPALQQSSAAPVASAAGGETGVQGASDESEPMGETHAAELASDISVPAPSPEAAAPRPTSGSFAGFDADAYGLPMASLDPARAAGPSSEVVAEQPSSEVPDADLSPAVPDQTEGSGFVMRDADPDEPAGEEATLAPQDSEQADAIPDESQHATPGSPANVETSRSKGSDYSDSSLPVWEAVAAEMAAAVATDPAPSDATGSSSIEAPAPIETGLADELPAMGTAAAGAEPADDAEGHATLEAESVVDPESVGDEPVLETAQAIDTGDAARDDGGETLSEPPDASSSADAAGPVEDPSPAFEEAEPPVEYEEAAAAADAEQETDELAHSSELSDESQTVEERGSDDTEVSEGAIEEAAHASTDLDGAFSYLVSDARFEVVDGELRLKDGINLDAKREPTIDVLVATIDAEGDSLAENYTVTVDESGGRPAAIPLNDPTADESERDQEAEGPAPEDVVPVDSAALGPAGEVLKEAEPSSQASNIPEASPQPESQELVPETNGQEPTAAAKESEEGPVAEPPKETVSVKSIEETFLVDEAVVAPDAGHDFLMLGSKEEAAEGEPAVESAGESNPPQPGEGKPVADSVDSDVDSDVVAGEDGDSPTAHASAPDSADVEPASDNAAQEIVGVADSGAAQDDAEWEAFLFEPEGTEPDSNKPTAEDDAGDTLDLSEVAESGRSWTILLNDGSEIKGTGEDYLDLTEDSSGTITFDDGTEMTFDSVERVTW